MDVSKVFHACTSQIYKDFSNQQISQKILKVALPIIALLAIGLALRHCLFLNQPFPKRVQKGPSDVEKTPPITQTQPSSIAPSAKAEGNVNLGDLEQQPNRCDNPPKLQRVVLSSGVEARHLVFSESQTSYIMVEPPKNSELAQWRTDFYRLAIEKDVKLILCTDLDPNSFFLEKGELQIDSWYIESRHYPLLGLEERYFQVRLLEITSHPNQEEKKEIWQFFLYSDFRDRHIHKFTNAIVQLYDLIKSEKFMEGETHPLLVTCQKGFGLSSSFISFLELQARIVVLRQQNKTLTAEEIKDLVDYSAILKSISKPAVENSGIEFTEDERWAYKEVTGRRIGIVFHGA